MSPMNETQDLANIMDHISILLNFMNDKFSLDKIQTIIPGENLIREDKWRNASLNIVAVRNFNTINMNILGLSSILGVHSTVLMYFENLAKSDREKWIKVYHQFILSTFGYFVKLLKIIINYLDGAYSNYLLDEQRFCLNRTVIYTLVKLWRIQTSFILRLSYKIKYLKTSGEINELNPFKECLDKLSQLYSLTIMFSKDLEKKYIGVFQAVQVVRYLAYMVEHSSMTTFVNQFWKNMFNSSNIPESVTEKINSKWGVGPKSEDFIDSYLDNPYMLSLINEDITMGMIKCLEDSDIDLERQEGWQNLDKFDLSLYNQDFFNQFVQANFEFF